MKKRIVRIAALLSGMCLFLLPAGNAFAAKAETAAGYTAAQTGVQTEADAAEKTSDDSEDLTAEDNETEKEREEADAAAAQSGEDDAEPDQVIDEKDASLSGSNVSRTRRLLGSPSSILKGAANQYAIGSSFFPKLSLYATYNGSNIILYFDFKLGTNDNIHHIYMGWSGELYQANARKPNGGSAPENTTSDFGTVTYTNITSFWYGSVDVAGYITITNPTGLANWYNSSNHAFWYSTYENSGGTDDPCICSNMNPMSIGGLSAAIAQAQCSHNFVYSPVDAKKHVCACTKCGHQLETSAHVFNLIDASSVPGYTITSCSLCGYIASKTANTYTVTLNSTDATEPGTTSVNVVFQSAMPSITIPKKTGYEFQGYYSGQNGTGTQYYTESGTSAHVYDLAINATLYPLWKQTCEIRVSDPVANEFTFAGV